MKKTQHYTVRKGGRVVDCLRAKDLTSAAEEAMQKWEKYTGQDDLIEIELLQDRVVVLPTKKEVREYAEAV